MAWAWLDELSALNWLAPWEPLAPAAAKARELALSRSLSEQHPLYGRAARALAARTDDVSDVLFVFENPDVLCVVNLSAGRKRSAQSPHFVVYESAQVFEQACMLPDHLEHSDEDI